MNMLDCEDEDIKNLERRWKLSRGFTQNLTGESITCFDSWRKIVNSPEIELTKAILKWKHNTPIQTVCVLTVYIGLAEHSTIEECGKFNTDDDRNLMNDRET